LGADEAHYQRTVTLPANRDGVLLHDHIVTLDYDGLRLYVYDQPVSDSGP
jgi:hypothetical protein